MTQIFLIFTLLFLIMEGVVEKGIAGVDFGSSNVVTAMVGGKMNLEVIQGLTGKRTIPSLVGIDGVHRYVGRDAYEKVFSPFYFRFFLFRTDCFVLANPSCQSNICEYHQHPRKRFPSLQLFISNSIGSTSCESHNSSFGVY